MDEKTAFVVKKLKRQVTHQNIAGELCELYGMDWPGAEKFIRQVAREHRSEIGKSHSLLVYVLAGTMLLVGIGTAFAGFIGVGGIQFELQLIITGVMTVIGSIVGIVWQVVKDMGG